MGRSPRRNVVERLSIETEPTSRRGFLGKLGKTATAVTLGGLASGVSSAMFGSAAYAARTVVNVPPYATLQPNGGDCTAAINSLIANAPDDGVILLFPGVPDRYQIDGTVRVDNKTNWTLDFYGSTLWTTLSGSNPPVQADRTRTHLRIADSSGVNINHLVIAGPKPVTAGYNPALEAQHGVEVESCSNVTVNSYICHDIWGDGLYIASRGASFAQSSNIQMISFQIDHTGRHGMTVVAGEHVSAWNGTLTNIGRTTLDIEPNTVNDTVLDVYLAGITITAHRLNFVSSVGGGTVDGVLVEAVTALGSTLQAAFKARDAGSVRKNLVMRNMSSDVAYGNTAGCLFNFNTCENVEVSNIDQPLQAGRTPSMQLARFWNCTQPMTVDGQKVCNEGQLVC